ncbi:MAG: aspartate--tRNA(Asn) ligase [Oscillospiraceae bacterium]|jgi:aspartyl-tRNA synthetase|nr:aspartate--tRNA(Asn) ligase [Oscillospiraceae bacterium]
MRTRIDKAPTGKPCEVCGFVENLRETGRMFFLVLRDASGKLQVTVEKSSMPALSAMCAELSPEFVVRVRGVINENTYVKLGGREMVPESIEVLSKAEPLPLQPDAHIDTRLDHRWLDLREDKNLLIFKAQTTLSEAMRSFLLERGFLELHSPKLIGAASESGADVFELGYFGGKAYLSQSPQFYKQMAMAAGFDAVFEQGPVFRAEKSHTNRHATEFTGFDLEFAYIDSFRDVMALEAELLQAGLRAVAEKHGADIERLFGIKTVVPLLPFPELTLRELYEKLEVIYGLQTPPEQRGDLTTEAERLAGKLSMDEYGHEFLFLTDFAPEGRAFYHMRDERGNPLGFDLVWRGVEITTGAQREHRYERLAAQANERGLGEDVKFYLDFFRYGCPPHGGFGLGLDRLTMLLLGVTIKEAMFLFRGPGRLTP